MALIDVAEPTDHYISNFIWNKVRYRSDKSLNELIDTLQKVVLVWATLKMYHC